MSEVTVWCYINSVTLNSAMPLKSRMISMRSKWVRNQSRMIYRYNLVFTSFNWPNCECYYNCIDKYFDRSDFEYIETDTDSAYMALSGQSLREIIKPEFKDEFDRRYLGNCNDDVSFEADSETYFLRDCCDAHRTFNSRAPGLFNLEASGKAMIALSSKAYVLDKGEGQESSKGGRFKLSCKGVNKTRVVDPYRTFETVLDTQQPWLVRNQGFRAHNNSVYTYEQEKIGLSYFYCKRRVLLDGIHTEPLSITLCPWEVEPREIILDENHVLSPTRRVHIVYDGEIFECVAEWCEWVRPNPHTDQQLIAILRQIPLPVGYRPSGSVVFPKSDCFPDDTYWTSALSGVTSSLLQRKQFPGFNKLGLMWDKIFREDEMLDDNVMVQ